jgi:IclR family transcriptional regulator, mhp operon transcriptional activator
MIEAIAMEEPPDRLDGVDASGGRYKHVHGLARGLAVLQTLVDAPNGSASPTEVAVRTGLHRTTVRRLLETLAEEGFVSRNEGDGSFQLTGRLRLMAASLTDHEWISNIAAPILRELSEKVVWPCDLSIPDGTTMLIRDSTHHSSPLSFHRGMIGSRLPMLRTAMGRAYLAFSRPEVREAALRLIQNDPDPAAWETGSGFDAEAVIERTRQQGFGLNYREWKPEERTAAIALPIMTRTHHVAACINIIVNTAGMTTERIVGDFLPPLRHAADLIEAEVRKQLAERDGAGPAQS